MNLETRVSALEDRAVARRDNVITITDEEHAAFGLSGMSLLASYDAEYAPRVASFIRLYGDSCNA